MRIIQAALKGWTGKFGKVGRAGQEGIQHIILGHLREGHWNFCFGWVLPYWCRGRRLQWMFRGERNREFDRLFALPWPLVSRLALNIVCCCEGVWVCAVLLICAGDATNEVSGQRRGSEVRGQRSKVNNFFEVESSTSSSNSNRILLYFALKEGALFCAPSFSSRFAPRNSSSSLAIHDTPTPDLNVGRPTLILLALFTRTYQKC